jgi:hypothetical protein
VGRGRNRTATSIIQLPPLGDDLGQGLAVDELHRVVMHPALAADGMDRHDVRVVQQRRGLGLGLEPLKLARVEPACQGQDLLGDPTMQRGLLGLIDDPHAAASDFAQDPEIAHDAQLRAGDSVRQRQAGSIPDCRAAQLGHHLEGGEQLAQSLGVLQVLGREFTRIERLACLEAL